MERSDTPEPSLNLSPSSQSSNMKSMLVQVLTMHTAEVGSLTGKLEKSKKKCLQLERAQDRVTQQNHETEKESEKLKAEIEVLNEKAQEPCAKCQSLQKKLSDLEKREATALKALYPLLVRKSKESIKDIVGDDFISQNSEFFDQLTESVNTCVEDVCTLDLVTVIGKPFGTSTQKPKRKRSPGDSPNKLQLKASGKRTRYIEEPLPERTRSKTSPNPPPTEMDSSVHEILAGESLNATMAPVRDDCNIRVIPETMQMDFDLTFDEDENSEEETVIMAADRSANNSPVFCKPNDPNNPSVPSPNLFDESFQKQAEKSAVESPSPSVLRNISVIKKDATPKRLSLKPKTPSKLKQTKLSVHAFKTNRRVELMRDQGKLVNRTLSLKEEEHLVIKKATEESLKTYAREIDLSSDDETVGPPSLETFDAPLNGTVAPDIHVLLTDEHSEPSIKQEKDDFGNLNRSRAKVERLVDVVDERLISKPSSSPNYAHVTVVRKQNERRQLNAFSCTECRKYYEARGLNESDLQEKMEACRHRAKYIPPSTPEGYWSVDFPDTLPAVKKELPKSSFLRANRKRNKYDKILDE